MSELGKMIKHYRERAGLTQEELANQIGTTKQTIYKYENGLISNIPNEKLEGMASIFGISPSSLVGWHDDIKLGAELNKIFENISVELGVDKHTLLDIFFSHDFNDLPKSKRVINEKNIKDALMPLLDSNKYSLGKPPLVVADATNHYSTGVSIPIVGTIVAGMPVDAYEDILGYEEISAALAKTGDFVCLRVRGDSMSPKIEAGDLVIVRLQSDVDSGDVAVVKINGDETTLKKVQKSEAGITLIAYNPAVYEPHFYNNEEIENLPVVVCGKVVEMKRTF